MIPSRIGLEPGMWVDDDLPEQEIVDAVCEMHGILIRRFQSRDLNCYSPVSLGRHLMSACWHRDGIRTPPVPSDVRKLLKSASPQGRHEIFTLPDLTTIPALYLYDMRLAYLWCCKGLPYGALCQEDPGSKDSHKQLVRWQAPEGWSHIGLLPDRQLGWWWPTRGEGWADRREIDLAERKGWSVTRWLGYRWEHGGALDRWSDGIQWAFRQMSEGSLVYRILRRVALWTIGSLHRTSTVVRQVGSVPPITRPGARYDAATSLYSWTEEREIRGQAAIYMHPEWTTTIWARCRAKVSQAALSVPREELVAIRQDAIYATAPQPQFETEKTARIGSIRLKWLRRGEMPAPHSIEELDALRRGE